MEEDAYKNEEEIEIVAEDGTEDSKTAKLKRDLLACRKDKEDYLQGWQRAKADYMNLDRQAALREERARKITAEKIFRELLDISDIFQEALKADIPDSPWISGIRQTYDKLQGLMKKFEIEVIEATGKRFDPSLHEALEMKDTEKEEEDDMILGEFQKGYMMKGEVLRPSKVKVAHYKKGE